jgi:hypothetical protein
MLPDRRSWGRRFGGPGVHVNQRWWVRRRRVSLPYARNERGLTGPYRVRSSATATVRSRTCERARQGPDRSKER